MNPIIAQTKTVLWSMVGLGRRKDMEQSRDRGNPLLLIPIFFLFVLIFLGTLALVAHAVVNA